MHPVTAFNGAFCMIFSLLMQVNDARGGHMEEACLRAMSVSCLPDHVGVSAFIICSGMCACSEML